MACFVQMDIVFAKVAMSEIPENFDVCNEELLRNLDLRCIRSLNGKFVYLLLLNSWFTLGGHLLALVLKASVRPLSGAALGLAREINTAVC